MLPWRPAARAFVFTDVSPRSQCWLPDHHTLPRVASGHPWRIQYRWDERVGAGAHHPREPWPHRRGYTAERVPYGVLVRQQDAHDARVFGRVQHAGADVLAGRRSVLGGGEPTLLGDEQPRVVPPLRDHDGEWQPRHHPGAEGDPQPQLPGRHDEHVEQVLLHGRVCGGEREPARCEQCCGPLACRVVDG